MNKGLKFTGVLSEEELKKCPGYPSEERFKKGPVTVIECIQEIPCNPCEVACPFGAIKVGDPIINLPVLDEEKCKGCGICISSCPGLAIFTVDMLYSKTEAVVVFPFEYLPLPKVGNEIEAVNREGKIVTTGRVLKIKNPSKNDHTPVISIVIPKEWATEVRSITIPQEEKEERIIERSQLS